MTMKDFTHSQLNADLSNPASSATSASATAGYSARRLNYLASELDATDYLEIGVETGSTFLNVDCSEKTGVDPAFKFNWEAENAISGIRLYQTSSDDFFKDLEPTKTYDLVFIDGLHTFEQTYRDILHSMRYSHAGTVFLIDDTVPCDVFSTCRDQHECTSLRSAYYGPGDIRWHGDTYKILPLLSLFNPDYEVVTIIDNGNPQTLLWRSDIEPAARELRTMQAMFAIQNLAAADYLWFLDNISLYNPTSEKEALGKVASHLKAISSI